MAATAWRDCRPTSTASGKAAFVPFVIPGEQVEASPVETRPGFVRAKLDKVLTPSPDRIEPGCPYFERCGGCHYQHINYDAQLRYKAEILRETLRRTAKLELAQEIQVHAVAAVELPQPHPHAECGTRRTFALGYYQHNSHDVLPVETCPISSPLINQAIAAVWKLGRDGAVPQSVHGLQFFANHDDTKLLVEAYVRPDESSSGRAGLQARVRGRELLAPPLRSQTSAAEEIRFMPETRA